MKAAVLHRYGEAPRYEDFPAPEPQNADQVLLHMKAAAIKNLDKGKASGAHYSSSALTQPVVVGQDGVGTLPDGTRVYAFGLTGMAAEQALADRRRVVKLPANLSDVAAAALPNALFGAAGALRFRAQVRPGSTVLIQGATGVTGKVAVQLARHYGAARVLATGRNPESLQALRALGADEVISLHQPDDELVARFREIHRQTPIDCVVDYLWGHPAELLLSALQGQGATTYPVRYVTVGGMAGDKIQLSSGTLRSSDIVLSGSGLGSIPDAEMRLVFSEMLPELLQLAADGRLTIDTVAVPLAEVADAWNREVPTGSRLVVTI